MNILVHLAQTHGRDYITPEDVTEAFGKHSVDEVRLAVLEVFGGLAGAEDAALCAFLAHKGPGRTEYLRKILEDVDIDPEEVLGDSRQTALEALEIAVESCLKEL